MKGRTGIWLKTHKEKAVSSFKRDVVVFAFFLFLSFIFWYLNSLRKDIEIDIRYPVRYVNAPKDWEIANELPSKLSFYLKGPGYSIIKLKISALRAPVVIDFSKVIYRRMPNTGQLEYYIVSTGLIQNFKKHLNADLQIVSIKPDTLFVVFEEKTKALSYGLISAGTLKRTLYLLYPGLPSSDFEFITKNRRK